MTILLVLLDIGRQGQPSWAGMPADPHRSVVAGQTRRRQGIVRFHHLYPIHRLLLYYLRSHNSTLPSVSYSITISFLSLYILPVGDNDRGLTTIIIKNNKITMKKEDEEAEEEERYYAPAIAAVSSFSTTLRVFQNLLKLHIFLQEQLGSSSSTSATSERKPRPIVSHKHTNDCTHALTPIFAITEITDLCLKYRKPFAGRRWKSKRSWWGVRPHCCCFLR